MMNSSSVNMKRKNPTSSSSSSLDSIQETWYLENNNDSLNNNGKRLKNELGSYENNGVHHDHHHDDDHGVGDDDDDEVNFAMPVGFLDPLPPLERELLNKQKSINNKNINNINKNNNKNVNGEIVKSYELNNKFIRRQFWKAGDYEGPQLGVHASPPSYSAGSMDHVRVHPKFLHSNATSHKWVLGAFAELLDNSLDEVCNGATYVSIDMVYNEKDRRNMLLSDKDRYRMLLIQDNGGGMNPEKMRQCMSLGYSAKSKMAKTIGQYGNGFKTSTMRLGADVIVFSMCQGKDGTGATRSVGLLSYTFLTNTGKEDIIVPMIDYTKKGDIWTKMLRGTLDDWHTNLKTIIDWSPYSSEQELLEQFDSFVHQGTRIVIYNLWEDDEGQLELDFGSDPEDIQIRGANRDEKKIALARKFPNSKHFLTYQHSLRSYASILYLRLPPGFRIILRGKDVVHHNLVNDMMHAKQSCYKPAAITDGSERGSAPSPEDTQALVTIGFAKDAVDHMDIQGFNVYHKNRLIKPFWRVWNAAGSDGRGVIGVLEANFVEPAHDKQGFEKTTALSRLEQRLNNMQKDFWRDHCQEIGYAPRRSMNKSNSKKGKNGSNKGNAATKGTPGNRIDVDNTCETPINTMRNSVKRPNQKSPVIDSSSDDEMMNDLYESPAPKTPQLRPNNKAEQINQNLQASSDLKEEVEKLRKENYELKNRLDDANEARDHWLEELQVEKERSKSLEAQLEEANKKNAEMDAEQESLIKIFEEERDRRNDEEIKFRERLQEASDTITKLLAKVEALEKLKLPERKRENY